MTKKEKDAEKFAKNMLELEQHLGRYLRPDELMLLAMFASVVNASEDGEEEEKVEQAADAIVSLAILGALLGIDPSSELKKRRTRSCVSLWKNAAATNVIIIRRKTNQLLGTKSLTML